VSTGKQMPMFRTSAMSEYGGIRVLKYVGNYLPVETARYF